MVGSLNGSDMRTAALEWWDAGCSIIRVKEDATKSPLGEWKNYQTTRADRGTVADWFANGATGLGVVCGRASGNLEMFEFEGRAIQEGFLATFGDECNNSGIGELWNRLKSTFAVCSPSGGLHVFFRVTGGTFGNKKLAQRPNGKLRDTLIETRGEGGYVVGAPSHGRVHASGLAWRALVGSPAVIPTITQEEYEALHNAARALDEMPVDTRDYFPPTPMSVNSDGLTPGEDFNQRGDWRDILEPAGWTFLYQRGHKSYWRRPDKRIGKSAVAGGDTGDYFTVFSSSTEFEPDRGYAKWRVYAMLNHGGDFAAAAGELRRQGYGAERDVLARPERALTALPTLTMGGATPAAPAAAETRSELEVRKIKRGQLGNLPKPEPLIAGTLDRHTIAMLAGYTSTYKSFLALDWSSALATGGFWYGRKAEQVRVLYVAAEGAIGLNERLNAWERSRATAIGDDDFTVIPVPVNLGQRQQVADLCKIISDDGIGFVVIDTLNRCAVGLDENSAKDMGQIVDMLYRVQEYTMDGRGTVLLVHHAGKDKSTIRGSSALEAGFDTVYTTSGGTDGPVNLARTKRKDGPLDDQMMLRFRKVEGTQSGVLDLVRDTPDEMRSSETRIMDIFGSHFGAGGCTRSDLIKIVGDSMSTSTVYEGLTNLLKRGFLVNDGSLKRPFYLPGDALPLRIERPDE